LETRSFVTEFIEKPPPSFARFRFLAQRIYSSDPLKPGTICNSAQVWGLGFEPQQRNEQMIHHELVN
jgi:hypothetical protein